MVHSDPEAQRDDLLQLLALIEDPREVAAGLRKSEHQWLVVAEQRLNLSGPSSFDGEALRRAELAYPLLVRSQ